MSEVHARKRGSEPRRGIAHRLVRENATDSAQIKEWGSGDENKARRAEVIRVEEFRLPYRMEGEHRNFAYRVQDLVCRRMRNTRGLA
jgi:hypothetical protein